MYFLLYRNDDSIEGGLSMVLDSRPILEELKAEHPQHFATLTRVPATFMAIHSRYVFFFTKYMIVHNIHVLLVYALFSRPSPADMSHQKPHIILEYDSDQV